MNERELKQKQINVYWLGLNEQVDQPYQVVWPDGTEIRSKWEAVATWLKEEGFSEPDTILQIITDYSCIGLLLADPEAGRGPQFTLPEALPRN